MCRAWNKELHTGAAAAAARQTLSLDGHLCNSLGITGAEGGITGEEGRMAAWAIRHREFVKELIIDHNFHAHWMVVSILVH